MKAPSLTPAAIAYAWERLWTVAGANALHTPRGYGSSQSELPAPGIIITPTPSEAWPQLLRLPSQSLDWLPAEALFPPGYPRPFDDPVPVLFWGERDEDAPIRRRDDGSVIITIDFIAATLFMLTRWEETVLPARDEHDRFPASASVAYRQGFLDQPIIDRYALILRAWLQTLYPSWIPQKRAFSVRLTHDVDRVERFRSWQEASRLFAGDLLRRRDPALALQTAGQAARQLFRPAHDVFLDGIGQLAGLSEAVGLRSTFYFLASGRSPYQIGYDPAQPRLRRLIEELRARGHEIGFHPGYDAHTDLDRFIQQKERLEAAIGPLQGGRQHYLRFRVPHTWRLWEQAGLAYDSSLGYSDHEGFRCGTCHPFRPFDIAQDRVMSLTEIPLLVMDNTLVQYRRLSPLQGEAVILTLLERVEQVGGDFVILWHNSSIVREWRPWLDVYRRLLPQLAARAARP